MSRTLVFDLDNTLVPCHEFYASTKSAFYQRMREIFPDLNTDQVLERFQAVELRKMSLPDGFSRLRYPQSMVETYQSFCAQFRRPPVTAEMEEVYGIGDSVFTAPYDLFPGVRDLLNRYAAAGFRLGLCTKGDQDVQMSKVVRNDLEDLFSVIRIVPQKTAEAIAETAQALGATHPSEAYKIGDSLRDDIRGGNLAGLKTVWVTGNVDSSYIYERGYESAIPTHQVYTVLDLPQIIPLS